MHQARRTTKDRQLQCISSMKCEMEEDSLLPRRTAVPNLPAGSSLELPPGLVIVLPITLSRCASVSKTAEPATSPATSAAVRPGAPPTVQTGPRNVQARALVHALPGRSWLREHAGATESHGAGRTRRLAHRNRAASIRVTIAVAIIWSRSDWFEESTATLIRCRTRRNGR